MNSDLSRDTTDQERIDWPPNLLMVGRQPNFALDADASLANCRWVDCLPTATRYLAAGGQAMLVVLVQSYPEQYTQSDIEALRGAAPLARIACVDGPWCEGRSRTGRRFYGVWRIYWHQQTSRLAQEFQRIAAGQLPAWSTPLTVSENELMVQSLSAFSLYELAGLHVLIDAQPAETRDNLFSALTRAGANPIYRDQSEPKARIDAIVWDDEGRSLRVRPKLAAMAVEYPSVPVIALLGFPRHNDYDCLTTLNDFPLRVLAKPFELRDLGWELINVTGRASADSRSLPRAG